MVAQGKREEEERRRRRRGGDRRGRRVKQKRGFGGRRTAGMVNGSESESDE